MNRRQFLGLGALASIAERFLAPQTEPRHLVGDDILLFDGEASGSIPAAGYPTMTVLQPGDPGYPVGSVLQVSDCLVSGAGLRSNAGLVLVRLALVWMIPDGTTKAFASAPGAAKPTVADAGAIPPTERHQNRWRTAGGAADPQPDWSVGVMLSPEGGETGTLIDGVCRFRFMYESA
jgi:hypothetical protein